MKPRLIVGVLPWFVAMSMFVYLRTLDLLVEGWTGFEASKYNPLTETVSGLVNDLEDWMAGE